MISSVVVLKAHVFNHRAWALETWSTNKLDKSLTLLSLVDSMSKVLN